MRIKWKIHSDFLISAHQAKKVIIHYPVSAYLQYQLFLILLLAVFTRNTEELFTGTERRHTKEQNIIKLYKSAFINGTCLLAS